MLREVKVWLDQLERDVLRLQGSEESLADKYQVKIYSTRQNVIVLYTRNVCIAI